MKNQSNRQILRSLYISGLLSIWSMGIVIFYCRQNSTLLYLGALLNIFIIIIALWRPISYAVWVSLLLTILIYTSTANYLSGANPQFLLTSAISAAIFLISAILGTIHRKQADTLAKQFLHQNRIIDALTINDQKTSLMKWRFARKALKAEILRSHRYRGELTLILFAVRKSSQSDHYDAQQDEKIMASIIKDVIRPDIDVAFKGKRLGIILPERDLSFSQAFAYKIIPIIQNNINAQISAGISTYPQDAETAQELINRAEEALQVALYTGLHLFKYQSLALEKKRERIRLRAFSEDTQQITKPVTIKSKKSPYEEYEKILKNIHLNQDEWIVWLKGVQQMEDVFELADNPLSMSHIIKYEFLYAQPNYLVLRIKTTLGHLIEHSQPFPGWEVEKVNSKQHYLMMRQA